MLTVEQLVDFYKLEPHPEGGFYKETYRSKENIEQAGLPERFRGDRSFSTAIYFLLPAGHFSAFHRIQSDELWHFYAGEPLNIYVINEDESLTTIKLGANIFNGETMQAVVKEGCWFASRPVKDTGYCFVGCTVSPGFDFVDFELAKAEVLVEIYPAHKDLINSLCRQ